MVWKNVQYQYYAAICVNIMTVSYGTSIGWTSASFLILQSDNSPLESGPITKEEASWIGSIMCLGGLTGNLIFCYVSDRIGRKPSMLLTAIPQTVAWLLIIIATNPTYLYISRFLCGISAGGILGVLPVYVTEISDNSIRGALGTFLIFGANTGILISFVIGNYLDYYIILYSLTTLPIIFLVGMLLLPETPQFLMKIGKEEEAIKSLKFFRNLKETKDNLQFNKEVQDIKDGLLSGNTTAEGNSLSWKDFSNALSRKALFFGITIVALNQFCGCFALLNYAATIFTESGSNLSPNMSAIIVGVIQLIAAYVAVLLVERTGRKLLMCLSAIGTAIGMIGLGLYDYLQFLGINVSSIEFLPVVSFSFAIFIATIGVLALPFVIIAEIMPPKIRTMGNSICMSFLWFFAFILVKFLHVLIETLDFYGCMFMFAICCLLGAIFVFFNIPETKGRSIEDIMKLLQ